MKHPKFQAKCILLFIMIIATPAMACESDTDCLPGSQCLKASGSMYGMCTGGLSAGNSNDQQPVGPPSTGNRTWGNSCAFDVDCAPGTHCFREGSSEGFCMIK